MSLSVQGLISMRNPRVVSASAATKYIEIPLAKFHIGGFPGWLLTGDYGTTRNNDSRYTEAWTPYMAAMAKISTEHAVTNGGNVILYQIENEYGQQWTDVDERVPNNTAIDYMELLEASARRNGIDIPTLANNPNLGSKSWSQDYDINDVGGNVDIYSLDNYPSCWSCDLSVCTSVNGFPPEFTTFDYYTNFQETAPTQPSILAEFQGGSYNPWNGPEGGCRNNTGPNWVNVFYRNNIGNKVAGQNIYMAFGGNSSQTALENSKAYANPFQGPTGEVSLSLWLARAMTIRRPLPRLECSLTSTRRPSC